MEDKIVPAEQQGFIVKDLGSLNWAFRKLAALKEKESKITELAKAERERIDMWLASELSPIKNDMTYFEEHIKRYHAEQLALDPKQKTLSTPYGKSKSRHSKQAIEKADSDKLLAYVVENDLHDYIKQDVKWADLKKALHIVDADTSVIVDDNGQIVPGVIVKPAMTTYTIEV